MMAELTQFPMELPEIQSMNAREIVKFKLQFAFEKVQDQLIVDDTGLYLECLRGFPGPMIKQLLETVGPEEVYHLSQRYGLPRAVAKASIGYIDKKGRMEFFEGSVSGRLVSPSGKDGFGWDVIFQPDGFEETYAQMRPYEKNRISHRFKALEQFRKFYYSP